MKTFKQVFGTSLLLVFMTGLIGGCGGGDGDDSGIDPDSWPAFVLPNMEVAQERYMTFTGAQGSPFITTSGPLAGLSSSAPPVLVIELNYVVEALERVNSPDSYARYVGIYCGDYACTGIDVAAGAQAAGMQYAEYGIYSLNMIGTGFYDFGAFSGGNNSLTPTDSMPSGITKVYVGKALGEVAIVDPSRDYELTGSVSVSVNFPEHKMQINLSSMQARDNYDGTVTEFNDVQMDLTISGYQCSGVNVSWMSNSNSAAALAPGATGQADCDFYGSTAEEVAGVLHLIDIHGNAAIIAFGAK